MNQAAHHIAILPGDGIGHEVAAAAERVLHAAVDAAGIAITTEQHPCGAVHYQQTGQAIAPATLDAIGRADAILFGAAGWPGIVDGNGVEIAPQIDMREHFQLFAGLRPIRLFPGVPGPLVRAEIDMLVIREQTEGLFAGRHDPASNDPDTAQDRMVITRRGCERLFELSFAQARARRAAGGRGHVTLFDKANVLRSNALMRRIFDEVAEKHPDIGTARVYIDAASMQMVTDPGRFDVIVTENQFGDIVSEIAAGIAGGLGIAPSADIGPAHAVFQPSHGTAPDIAGRGIANPIAAILSAALMLDWLQDRKSDPRCGAAANAVRAAVAAVLLDGPRTGDLGGAATTDEVATAVIEALTA
jgi:3-isopropylmalate dehydrogenase